MRTIAILGLVSAYLLYPHQSGAAEGIAGWPLLRWGMTKQQVQKAYPNFEEFNKIGIKGLVGVGWVKAFGLQSYDAAGCEFSVDLSFIENQLVEVRLESIVLKGSLFDKYCTAKDELTEQYGPPTVDQVTPTFPMFHWTTGDTEVIYFVITAHDGSYKISVAYQKRGWLEDKAKHPGHL